MPAASVLGDNGSGHGPFPPHAAIAGCSKVMIGGVPALNVGSSLAPHCNPSPSCHPGGVGAGSGKVMLEGAPAARIGDNVDCGGVLIKGSPKVLIGG